jgi:probable LLM family oxidoreductase
MEVGLFSFGEIDVEHSANGRHGAATRLQNLLEEIRLADELGLDVFGVGEHHRPDYAVSAPPVVLAAAASITSNIRLTSAVTVLGSEDPVRVFQAFSTLDLISKGRAEIMAGRGSFIESFPLFGFALDDYNELFSEKLDLLLELNRAEQVHWSGKHRAAIRGLGVYPRPFQPEIPVWIAVGGTPESAVRAGMLGLPMALGIIGGDPARFAAFANWHREAARRSGKPRPALSLNVHGFLADDGAVAREIAFPAFKSTMDRIGRERGWPPLTREQFEASTTLHGANFVGSPDEMIEKILHLHEIFRHDRMLFQFTVGPIEHQKVLRSIELFATKVAPAVKAAVRGAS